MDSTTATAELGWTVHPPSGVSDPGFWSLVWGVLLRANEGGWLNRGWPLKPGALAK